jgi:nitroreductase
MQVMSNPFSEKDNVVLDRIIEARRSIRVFKKDVPPDSVIKGIIHAGVYAPYAALAVGDIPDFRRFFVFRNGNNNLPILNEIIKQSARVGLERLEQQAQNNPAFMGKSARYIQRMKKESPFRG